MTVKNPNELWPNSEPTADELTRYFIACGLRDFSRLMAIDPSDLDRWGTEGSRLVAQVRHAHDVAAVLRTARAADLKVADEMAAVIWRAGMAGDSYGEWLYEWAIEDGIDPVDYTTGGAQR